MKNKIDEILCKISTAFYEAQSIYWKSPEKFSYPKLEDIKELINSNSAASALLAEFFGKSNKNPKIEVELLYPVYPHSEYSQPSISCYVSFPKGGKMVQITKDFTPAVFDLNERIAVKLMDKNEKIKFSKGKPKLTIPSVGWSLQRNLP